MRRTAFLVLLLLCGACAARPSGGPHWQADQAEPGSRLHVCTEVFAATERAIEAAGVRDAEAMLVPGHPHLRADRFLASFRKEDLSVGARADWLARMAELDRQGREVELRNLSAAQVTALRGDLAALAGGDAEPAALVESCRATLLAHDRASPEQLPALRQATYVPDHYDRVQQAFGLYPLTSIGVAFGYGRWKAENLVGFETNWDEIPVEGKLIAWLPDDDEIRLDAAANHDWPPAVGTDALGVPLQSEAALRRLAARHAPVLVIDTLSDADLIGRPIPAEVAPEGRPQVVTEDPVAFVRLAYTRFAGKVLTQLVYGFWFDARPPSAGSEILAGHLDGLMWRVTLDRDGRPLVYDSIHPCGCYHLFFPVPPTERRSVAEDRDLREGALAPASAPVLGKGERIVLRVQAGTHYLQNVASTGAVAPSARRRGYRLALNTSIPDLDLRSIPTGRPDRPYRSLYDVTGLIEGTQRSERYLLWPMGIASAGAMRQWGTHATAFVGTRHFDDPFLFDRSFRSPGSAVDPQAAQDAPGAPTATD